MSSTFWARDYLDGVEGGPTVAPSWAWRGYIFQPARAMWITHLFGSGYEFEDFCQVAIGEWCPLTEQVLSIETSLDGLWRDAGEDPDGGPVTPVVLRPDKWYVLAGMAYGPTYEHLSWQWGFAGPMQTFTTDQAIRTHQFVAIDRPYVFDSGAYSTDVNDLIGATAASQTLAEPLPDIGFGYTFLDRNEIPEGKSSFRIDPLTGDYVRAGDVGLEFGGLESRLYIKLASVRGEMIDGDNVGTNLQEIARKGGAGVIQRAASDIRRTLKQEIDRGELRDLSIDVSVPYPGRLQVEIRATDGRTGSPVLLSIPVV